MMKNVTLVMLFVTVLFIANFTLNADKCYGQWIQMSNGMGNTQSVNAFAVSGNNLSTEKYQLSVCHPSLSELIGVMNNCKKIPAAFSLIQNYPNPFNPSTNIQFDIPKTSFVKLAVYGVLGKEIDVLVNEELKAGIYNCIWDASALNSGLYFYKLSSDKFTDIRKMVLIK